jgi:hypothetical protein
MQQAERFHDAIPATMALPGVHPKSSDVGIGSGCECSHDRCWKQLTTQGRRYASDLPVWDARLPELSGGLARLCLPGA